MYLTQKERKHLLVECGINAMVLYEFYCTKIGVPDYDFDDGKAASAIGLSERIVQRARLVLEKAGYFGKTNYYSHDKQKLTVFRLGRVDEEGKFVPIAEDTDDTDGASDGDLAPAETLEAVA